MPEHKEVIIAIMGAATGLGAMLLVFQGLLLTILGNAPLPEARELDAISSEGVRSGATPSGLISDPNDSRLVQKKRENLERMLHQYYTVLRLAVWFDLGVLVFTFAIVGLALAWMLSNDEALYHTILSLFFLDLILIAFEAAMGTWVIVQKRVSFYDPY
jgi:hypothetical protein